MTLSNVFLETLATSCKQSYEEKSGVREGINDLTVQILLLTIYNIFLTDCKSKNVNLKRKRWKRHNSVPFPWPPLDDSYCGERRCTRLLDFSEGSSASSYQDSTLGSSTVCFDSCICCNLCFGCPLQNNDPVKYCYNTSLSELEITRQTSARFIDLIYCN